MDLNYSVNCSCKKDWIGQICNIPTSKVPSILKKVQNDLNNLIYHSLISNKMYNSIKIYNELILNNNTLITNNLLHEIYLLTEEQVKLMENKPSLQNKNLINLLEFSLSLVL